MIPWRFTICVLVAAGIVSVAAPRAERGQNAIPRPGWLPEYYNSRFADELTAAHRAEVTRLLQEVERILARVPELGSPKGFEIQRQISGGGLMTDVDDVVIPGTVLSSMLTLYFFAPTQAIAGEGCTCIRVALNFRDLLGAIDQVRGAYSDGKGRAIFSEPERGERAPFTSDVYGKLTPGQGGYVAAILTSGGEPYARAVTREEYYHAVLRDLEGKDGAKVAETRQQFAKTPYQQWMDGAEQRRKEREDTLKALAAVQPAEVAKMRKMLEDTEREITENLKASDAADRARNKEGLAQYEGVASRIRAELMAMTPAQRRMPAITDFERNDGFNATGPTMADRDGPGMRRWLMPNYDLWRARNSPLEVHSIVVRITASGTGLVPAVNNALVQTYRKLDWAALNKLLDR